MSFPNLDSCAEIAIDIETHDPNLQELGPGCRRKDGFILGVALSTKDKEWYLPTEKEGAYDSPVFQYIKTLFLMKNKLWITANGLYDFDWLQYPCGVPKGTFFDIQWAEALLDGNRSTYTLDSIAFDRLGHHKNEEELIAYCAERRWKNPKKCLKDVPINIVSRYAKVDARLTFDVRLKQVPLIRHKELELVSDMEHKLTPLYLQMRRNGSRVSEKGLAEAHDEIAVLLRESQSKLDAVAGFPVAVASANNLAIMFDSLSIPYHYTVPNKKTKNLANFVPKPSFTADYLANVDHEIGGLILQRRMAGKTMSTYIEGISRFLIDGRVHPLIHPLRTDEGGAVTGRMSGSLPNIQNIPSRVKKIKGMIRGLFMPEEGYLWAKTDHSQCEYRVFAHFACGEGAQELRDAYRNNPNMDAHTEMARRANCSRGLAKTVDFGVMFDMGSEKLSRILPIDNPALFLSNFHDQNPFFRASLRECSRVVKSRGYSKTILGRRRDIPQEKVYIGLNSTIQGSAADILKMGMLKSYEAGVYNILIPHFPVHDEMDNSVPDTKEGIEALLEQNRLFETAIQLKVPLRTDTELGTNWANGTKECFEEVKRKYHAN